VVVVSHRPRPDGWHPEASYHFVDDVAQAIAKAMELAGERTVAVAAGNVGGQALALGLGTATGCCTCATGFGADGPTVVVRPPVLSQLPDRRWVQPHFGDVSRHMPIAPAPL
jgi:hypothetical protein